MKGSNVDMTVTVNTQKSPIIESKRQIIEWFESVCSPKTSWAIGTEHEKFAYCRNNLKLIKYDGDFGVRLFLTKLYQDYQWNPIFESDKIIALSKGKSFISLEPGGQIELSGAPLKNIHQTFTELQNHFSEVLNICNHMKIDMLGIGYYPKSLQKDPPWMPKKRYNLMRKYMPHVGLLGLDMMLRTATIQVNLDFSSEKDMVKKFKTSLALQPIVTALFSSSPFINDKPSGYLSYRSYIWTKTDPQRCGMLPFVFEEGFGFERYVDYLLDLPMYFIIRKGKYINALGKSFRSFMNGKLDILPGERPRLNDWLNHITTAFPEVRLKNCLEMRGADSGPYNHICSLSALWVGLLYDDASLEAAWELVKDLSCEDRENLRRNVPKTALSTKFKTGTVQDIIKDILEISRAGLKNRHFLNHMGQDESIFIDILDDIAQSGQTIADIFLEKYNNQWRKSVDPMFEEYSYNIKDISI